jgi:two-component system sensor histidine kinase KdpD
MGRGTLRIYLGAAAGVGKTVSMLDEGSRRLSRGTDLVVAFVETHGRPHTAEHLEGLPTVPRKSVFYRDLVRTSGAGRMWTRCSTPVSTSSAR